MKFRFTIILLLLLPFIPVLNAQISLPYEQDFEDGIFPPPNCQFFGNLSSPTWQRSTTVGGYGASSACMYFDNFTTDNTGNYFGVRMPSASFTGINVPTISFDVAYARFDASRSDRLGLWYSTNGTTGWSNLINYQNTTLTTAPDQTTLFVPDSSQWVTKTFSMPSLSGLPLVRLAFENNSDHGNVLYIDNVHIFDSSPTGLDAGMNAGTFMVFPNPAQDLLMITQPDAIGECTLQLFDLSGRGLAIPSVQRITQNKMQLNVSGVQPGLYLLGITTEDGHFAQKVMISR